MSMLSAPVLRRHAWSRGQRHRCVVTAAIAVVVATERGRGDLEVLPGTCPCG